MRPAPTCSRTAGSRSTPITSIPRSANESASGRPTRPRPTTATLSAMSGNLRSRSALLSQILARERQHEARVRVEVARQKAPRLLRDPVDPLEPAILHPGRGHRDAARVEVEGRADPAHHRHVEPVAHAGHPLLLLRDPNPYPQHVGPCLVDLANERLLLLVRERPERGRV